MSANQLDDELTAEEMATLKSHYPDLVAQGAEGYKYCIYSRRELLALSARYPSLVTHTQVRQAPADALAARYPNTKF